MRPSLFFAAICAVATLSGGAQASGEGGAEDEELPQLPETAAQEPPHGAQDGTILGATFGAAEGISQAGLWSPQTTATSPTQKYAGLDKATCEAELGRRKIGFDRVGEARGVVAPVRLTGTVGGVSFHSMLPAAQRKTSPYEIYDCRLVLALDDFAKILKNHDIVEVIHYSVYRPPGKKEVLKGPGRRHSGALAIDAAIFKTKDGKTIGVEKDFHGKIGAKTCGVPMAHLSAEAQTLRKLVCEAADAQLFNVLLTPDYNWPHRNHFHLEVTAGVKWVLVR